jgi:hypothetical protein
LPSVPESIPRARFEAVRVGAFHARPAAEPGSIDVALLDMNAGFANVGHDAILAIVRDAALGLDEELRRRERRIRVLSYAVRDGLAVPDHSDGRHSLYLGTGGPGHLDPRRNTASLGAVEIVEDPAWEAPLFRLFEAIAADSEAAFFGVCHSFGLVCRWSGAAQPVLRGPEKGGPRSGVGTNVLTLEALAHPYFSGLAGPSASAVVVPVLDSRFYDLIPQSPAPLGVVPIAFESSFAGDGPGEAMTMLEVAREPGGRPRFFAVNSHPEIGSPERIAGILQRLLESGAMTADVYKQRVRILPVLRDDRREERLRVGRFVFSDLVHERLAAILRAAA